MPEAQNQPQRSWPQIIILLLGLTTFSYTVWSQANPWFLALPAFLTLIALVMLFRDIGVFKWCSSKRLHWKANKVARQEYPRFVKMVERARIHQDLVRELRNIDWKIQTPQFACMSFENWYGDILGKIRRLKINDAIELELIADRFRNLISVMNSDHFRPISEALRQGHAKYRNEQGLKSARTAKDAYDRFIEAYNIFCDEVNEKANRTLLIKIFDPAPAVDWEASAPVDSKKFTTVGDS